MAAGKSINPVNRPHRLYLIGFIAALAALGLAAYLALGGKLTGWEYTWFMAINGWSEGLYRPMAVLTMLGSTWMAAATVATAFFARMYRLAWRLAFSMLGAYAAVFALKHIVGRPRPLELFDGVHVRVAESEMGFPSGHATLATVIVLTLLPYVPRKWWWLLGVIATAVMLSRLYLGVHLPLDIVGGAALGTVVVVFLQLLPQGLRRWLRIA